MSNSVPRILGGVEKGMKKKLCKNKKSAWKVQRFVEEFYNYNPKEQTPIKYFYSLFGIFCIWALPCFFFKILFFSSSVYPVCMMTGMINSLCLCIALLIPTFLWCNSLEMSASWDCSGDIDFWWAVLDSKLLKASASWRLISSRGVSPFRM